MALFSKKQENSNSKYYNLNLDSTINDIESNISTGVYVNIKSLYEKDDSIIAKIADKFAPFGSKGNSILQKNVFGKDLLIEENKISIMTNNSSLLGRIGSLSGEGNLELYLNNITSVKYREGSSSQNGYISFVFPGKQDKGTGWLDSLSSGADPYTIYFPKSSNNLFSNVIKKYLDKIISSQQNRNGQTIQGVDPTLQLEKLNELKEKGIITETEFLEKKKSILDKL